MDLSSAGWDPERGQERHHRSCAFSPGLSLAFISSHEAVCPQTPSCHRSICIFLFYFCVSQYFCPSPEAPWIVGEGVFSLNAGRHWRGPKGPSFSRCGFTSHPENIQKSDISSTKIKVKLMTPTHINFGKKFMCTQTLWECSVFHLAPHPVITD